MRARRLLKASSGSVLCIFCASRFQIQQQIASAANASSRRLISSTPLPRQSSAASAVRADTSNGDPAPAPASTWDPSDTLSASERAEKERRRERQLQAQAEAAQVSRQQEEERRRQWVALQKQRERVDRISAQEREQVALPERNVKARTEAAPQERNTQQNQPQRENKHRQLHANRQARNIETQQRQAEARHLQLSRSLFGPRKDHRGPERAGQSQQTTPVPAKTAKPSFAASSSSVQSPILDADGGDGTNLDIKPLQYRDNSEPPEQPPSTQRQTGFKIRYEGSGLGVPSALREASAPRNGPSQDRGKRDKSLQPTRDERPLGTSSQRWSQRDDMQRTRNVRDTPAASNQYRATFLDNAQTFKQALPRDRDSEQSTWHHLSKQSASAGPSESQTARPLEQRSTNGYAQQSGFRSLFDKHEARREGGNRELIPRLVDSRSSMRATEPSASRFDPGSTASYQPPLRLERDERRITASSARNDVPEKSEPEDDDRETRAEERRARRSQRGFEDVEARPSKDAEEARRARRGGRRGSMALDDEAADEAAALREAHNARKAARKAAREAEQKETGVPIRLPDFVSVSQLAQTLNVHYDQFVDRLAALGYDDIFPGKVLNAETSALIAMEYNFDPIFETPAERMEEEDRDLKARPAVEDSSFLPTRPPVVTIMGHVDHGKTTILDFLRKSSVAAGEAGGITQHIGAFSVLLSESGKSITFLDTPGHAAFLSMRQRGANVTDIVILVVAADDSVKPQTLESIRCAREAGVPILVAINKVDKEEADIQRVKADLARNGVEIEDFGGDTQVVCVSGKTGQGMADLEEAVITLSEILDHRAEIDGGVEGWVLEATTKKAGRVATVLVKRGTLRPGNIIVAGKTWAKVRSLQNEAGQTIREAGPGLPVEVDGWRDQPMAGDEVLQAPNEHKATDVVEYRMEIEERNRTAQDMEAINEARKAEQEKRLKEKADAAPASPASPAAETSSAQRTPDTTEEEMGQMTVPFIIKADVSGSAEAVAAYVPSLTSPLITPQILRSGVGAVHESDIELAAVANGHIIAFNLPPDADARAAAEARGVKILENDIIYRVLEDVKTVLEEKLPPLITQRVLGEAEIGAAFDIKLSGRKVVWIAGCKVRNGVVRKGSRVRVLRGGQKIYDGTINSLKNIKKDVTEMRKGTECGMGFEEWQEFEIGDQVQTYEVISEKRTL